MIFCVAEQCPQRMSVCVRCIYYVHTSSYLYIYKYVAILVPWYVLLHIHTLYCNLLYYCVTVLNKNNQTGHKRKKGISPLSGGVPYEITLIRLNQVSLDRRRREKVIWEMITEHSCNPFANLKC